jgi:hypothetical protein
MRDAPADSDRSRRPVGLAVAACSVGSVWSVLRLLSWIEIGIVEQAMAAGQGGRACSGAGLWLYLAASWIPTLLASKVGLVLGGVALARRGSRAWVAAGLLINAALLAWQVLQLAGVLPYPRHPCLR